MEIAAILVVCVTPHYCMEVAVPMDTGTLAICEQHVARFGKEWAKWHGYRLKKSHCEMVERVYHYTDVLPTS